MFVLSKVLWMLLDPANLPLWVLLAAVVLILRRRMEALRRLLLWGTAGLLVVGVAPFGQWALVLLETRFPPLLAPAEPDGIIVLGGAADPALSRIWGVTNLHESGERLTAFAALSRRFPEARLVFTGGSGNVLDPERSEAPAARTLLEELGVDVSRVQFEGRSRNTHENAVFSKDLVRPAPGERWLLVTSAAHMPRAVAVFMAQDWPVIPYPVDHQTDGTMQLLPHSNLLAGLWQTSLASRELLGLAAYRLLGRTQTLWP